MIETYIWRGSHVTITHDALDLTVQVPPPTEHQYEKNIGHKTVTELTRSHRVIYRCCSTVLIIHSELLWLSYAFSLMVIHWENVFPAKLIGSTFILGHSISLRNVIFNFSIHRRPIRMHVCAKLEAQLSTVLPNTVTVIHFFTPARKAINFPTI